MSPVHHPFATKVPIWVQVGTAEFFYESVVKWVREMVVVAGNVVELYEVEDAMHDVFAVGKEWGMERQAVDAVRDAKRFLAAVESK